MKFIVVFVLGIQVCLAGPFLTFKNFQLKHNKTYSSDEESLLREQIFNSNLAKIEEHNQKYDAGLVSYKMGVTQFADLTEEEFAARFKTFALDYNFLRGAEIHDSSKLNLNELPSSIDWRQRGVVTGVKNQGSCGGCWAFSTTGTLEAQLALKQGRLISLSEQQLLDCDTGTNQGCNGGVVQYAIDYVTKNGLTTEDGYSYVARQGSCRRTSQSVVRSQGYVEIRPYNETDLKVAVGLIGPVSVAINSSPLQLYSSGIIDTTCSAAIDHAVLAVGYGTDSRTGKNYWIIKNSWGPSWGESGYYKLALGKGLCGIARQACYPVGVTSA